MSEPTIVAAAIAKLREIAPWIEVHSAHDDRVPLTQLHDLWNEIIAREQRRDLPLVLAQRYTPGDYGLVGFACVNSATVGAGLQHLIRYWGLWTDEPRVRIEGNKIILHYQTRMKESAGKDCATEAAFAELINGIRKLIGQEIKPKAIAFAHAKPKDTQPFDDYFGTKVRFEAEQTQLELDENDLQTPLPKADERLGKFLRDLANEALAKKGPQDNLQSELRNFIAKNLQSGIPTAKEAAKALHTSERTLRRRLEEEKTSFKMLLDETRKEMAEAYVKDKRLPMAEVAFLLGFSEASTFHRAFKRWTKRTPAEFRARK